MRDKYERHGDALAVYDCLKYHASVGGEYEYRGTLALEAFDRICTALLDLQAQRDELLAAAKRLSSERTMGIAPLEAWNILRAAIANAEKEG